MMRYQNQELRAMLCREYVLGTMSQLVRKRFERLLANDWALKDAVNLLQNKFYPLYDNITPVKPPAQVWARIQERLSFAGRKTPIWSRFGFWRNFAAVNFCLTIALVALLLGTKPDAPAYLAVLNGDNNLPTLLVQAGANKEEIQVQVIAPIAVLASQSLELWLIEGDNAPRSLGLLPTSGQLTLALPAALREGIAANNILAVSLEPAGGSPTHQPTGPVLFKGALQII